MSIHRISRQRPVLQQPNAIAKRRAPSREPVSRQLDSFDTSSVKAPAQPRPGGTRAAPTSLEPLLNQVAALLKQLLGRSSAAASSVDAGGSTTPAGWVLAAKSASSGDQVSSSPPSAADSFRQLVDADMRLAYGHPASEGDYAYWLPKLQGPNDSGLVTSGQMGATEYWHRRMLGWQAGGNEATSGPYAGGVEAHGPVPSATDMVPSVPPDSTTPVSPTTPQVLRSGPRAGEPSTWTDNNAPYGVTLAGFSPQNHTDLTPAELQSTDPANLTKNAKYLVYNYLLEHRTQPTKTWAPDAAAALNERYRTNLFHAIDGETLGYGDEFVHSAPNGYGMPAGTYDPSAAGELFWGSTGS